MDEQKGQDIVTEKVPEKVVKDAKPKKKNEGKEEKKFTLKTPKGTRDYEPDEMAIREKVFETVISCFKRHGAVTIETPLFELKVTHYNLLRYSNCKGNTDWKVW
jgi:histidyl-tRNA synthetase